MRRWNKELHEAARTGDLAALMLLVQQGADVNEIGPHRWSLLSTAAHSGDPEVVRWLLENGADIEARDQDGMNVLHHAAMMGRAEVVRFLLKRGCDPNIYDAFGGYTPLHRMAAHSSRKTDLATANALLDSGASIDARNKWGNTALMHAATGGRPELVGLLLDRGADIHARNNDAATALMLIARHGFRKEVIAPLLLQRGAAVDVQDVVSRTALMMAAEEANTEIAEILLQFGASVNLQDSEGRTALIYAAGPAPHGTPIRIIREIRDPAKAERNRRDPGIVKLVGNEWQRRANTVRLLLANGADPSIRDKEGRTALDWARQETGSDAVVNALMP